ncbi:hypothetical protein ACSW87_02805 [Clostridium perfringens]
MKIEKCRWKNGSKSAVMFMIDDLANKYIKFNKCVQGCDWGAKGFTQGSFFNFLNKNLLEKYPYIKTTFFLVVGKREPIIKNGNDYYSDSIDANESIRNFIKILSEYDNIELAYHGFTHGKCGDNIDDFLEEWETFSSVDEAIECIIKGKTMFKKVTGKDFLGGKYCGYKYNEYSDESIRRSGFLWWCKDWDGDLFEINRNDVSFDIREKDGVWMLPSNIDGSFYTLKNTKKFFTKKYIKSIYMLLTKRLTLEKQLDYLINNQYLISIQEHTSPYRVDNRTQYPNIVSDIENLNYIFNYLKKYDLWYATGSEIVKYTRSFENTTIDSSSDGFKIFCNKVDEGETLTIRIESCKKLKKLVSNDEEIELINKGKNRYIANIKLNNEKQYKVL